MANAGNEWIFITYRRDDTGTEAGWLAAQLKARFSSGAVFIDQRGIDWGVDFDQVLAKRVNSALVVLVLIGPQWLSSLKARAERAAKEAVPVGHPPACDYVRLEVAGALDRADEGCCLVVPILCGAATMPEANALAAAGFPDLVSLATKNGPKFAHQPVELGGPLAQVDAAIVDRLAQRAEEAAAQFSGHGDLSRGTAVAKLGITAAAILADQDMAKLAARWRARNVQGSLATSATDAIGSFSLALKEWNRDRDELPRIVATRVRGNCWKLLGGLVACAIDQVQAHRLVSSGTPVPTVSRGLSAAAYLLGKGGWPSFRDDLERRKGDGDFLLKRQLHEAWDAPNAGALKDRQDQVEVRFHNLVFSNDGMGEKVQLLTPDQKRNLKAVLALEGKDDDGPFMLSAVAALPHQQSDLEALAAALGVVPLAYTGEDGEEHSLCFDDQIALLVAIGRCLDHIQEIR